MRSRVVVLASLLAVVAVFPAAAGSWVIPVFAEAVAGANGSRWQSELRLTNLGYSSAASVKFIRAMPQADIACTLPQTVTIGPRATVALRSVGCGAGTLAGAEIAADGTVRVDVVLFETKDPLDAEVLSGVSTTIPITPSSELARPFGDVANLLVNRRKQRVNLFLFGPSAPIGTPIGTCFWILDAQGDVVQGGWVVMNKDRIAVLGDVLSDFGVDGRPPLKPLPESGVFTINLHPCTAGNPSPNWPAHLAIVSVVDNATNDSTIFTTGQSSFNKPGF